MVEEFDRNKIYQDILTRTQNSRRARF